MKNEYGAIIHRTTLGRWLKKIQGVRMIKKKLVFELTQRHKKARLDWCLKHRNRDWMTVMFADEKLFVGQVHVREKRYTTNSAQQQMTPKLQNPPEVYFWGMVGCARDPILTTMEKHPDTDDYFRMLQCTLQPGTEDDEFIHDNASFHGTKKRVWELRRILESKGFSLADLPPRSPDLNPIENVWGTITNRIFSRGRFYRTAAELEQSVKSAFEIVVKEQMTAKLNESMRKRCEEVIAVKGDYPPTRF